MFQIPYRAIGAPLKTTVAPSKPNGAPTRAPGTLLKTTVAPFKQSMTVAYLEFRKGGPRSRRVPPHLRKAPCSISNMFSLRSEILLSGGGGWRGSDFDLFDTEDPEHTRELHHLSSPKVPSLARCLTFLVKLLHFYYLILISPHLPCLIHGTLYLMMHCLRVTVR